MPPVELRAVTSYAARSILVTVLLVALAACSSDDPPDSPDTTTAGSPSASEATESSAPVTPGDAELTWEPVTETADVVKTQTWTLGMTGASSALLSGPEERELNFDGSLAVSEVLLDDSYAVVVLQDPMENEPSAATIYPLDSEGSFTVDGKSSAPTTNGGTWAMGEGKLFHATYGDDGAYCLAEVDLATEESSIAWCAPKDQGFNDARITPAGLTVMSFTLGQEGCRTPVTIEEGEATPIEGITECVGWDSLLTPDGTVWSEVRDPNRVEEATFLASANDQVEDLGAGDTGSLVWCGTAAYFTQQPQLDTDPARLLRWRDGAVDVVYETPGSPGFISEPRCGGNQITITSESEGGDEQVTAAVD